MNTCGTCKHKGEDIPVRNYVCTMTDKGYERPDGTVVELVDDRPPFDRTFFLCDRVKHIQQPDWAAPELGEDNVFVIDGSGYYAALCVEDDFGCNKWEAA